MFTLKNYYTISLGNQNQLPSSGFWKLFINKGVAQELKDLALQYPLMESWHECPDIYIDAHSPYQALFFIQKIARFHRNNNILWLSHTLFDDNLATDYIEIVEGNSARSTHHFWKRIYPFTLRTTEQSSRGNDDTSEQIDLHKQLAHSRGVLYQYRGKGEGYRPKIAKLPRFKLEAQSNVQSNDEHGKSILQDVMVSLNPLIFKFDPCDSWPKEQQMSEIGKQLIDQHRDNQHLLDVVPVFSQQRSFQLRLHQELSLQWQDYSSHQQHWPLIPQLLFKSDWQPAYIPFLMLDALQGQFSIKNIGSKQEKQIYWQQQEQLPDHAQWIADWSMDKTKIQSHITHGTLPNVINKPHFARHHSLIDQQNEKGQYQYIQHNLFKPFNDCLNGYTKMEQWILKQLQAECTTASGILFEQFVSLFGKKYLLPQSPIHVDLPAAPTLLATDQMAQWNAFCTNHVIDVTQSPQYAERWWLELITPNAMKKNNKNSQLTQKWSANNASWWFLYYQSLFTQTARFVPLWVFHGSNRIHQGKVGQILLGKKGNSVENTITYLHKFSLS